MPMSIAVLCRGEFKEHVATSDAMDFLQGLGNILGSEVLHAIGGHQGMERRVRERQREHRSVGKTTWKPLITA